MVEALRLLLLVLALGSGLVSMTYCGWMFQARRTALFRALLANIALFNLLILSGLVFWYARFHLEQAAPGTVILLLSGMTLLKVAWLVAFLALTRSLAVEGRSWGGVVAGGALLLVHGAFLTAAWLSGRQGWYWTGFGVVEVAVLIAALGASAWLLSQPRVAAGIPNKSRLWFAGFHIAIFTTLLTGVAWSWMRPGTGKDLPLLSALLMMTYNLFPIGWVRYFHSHKDPGGTEDLDRFGLTSREREIIGLLCAGKANQEIADELFISVATVKDHNSNIFRKTGARNRVALINLFRGQPSRE